MLLADNGKRQHDKPIASRAYFRLRSPPNAIYNMQQRDYTPPRTNRRFFRGAVAQLGERYVRNVEVRGSIPLGSTKNP